MTALPYTTLAQKNPDGYFEHAWRELDDLYVGGYQLQAHAERYLPRHPGEPVRRYRERLACAGYINYFAEVVDFFVAKTFSSDVVVAPAADADNPDTVGAEVVDPYWQSFAQDADLRKSKFSAIVRSALRTALIKKRAVIACDLPSVDAVLETRADEDAFGAARGYCFEVEPESLIDWECDERGRFVWAILHRCIERRPSPASPGRIRIEEFKVWEMVDGLARWSLFCAPLGSDSKRQQGEEIPLIAQGMTSFRRIPIVTLELPSGLWVGNKIGLLVREHYRRRTMLVSAEDNSLVAIPVVRLGPEMGAIGGEKVADVQENPHRGDDPVGRFEREGFLVLGKDDDFAFQEPNGAPYSVINDQLSGLVDEIFRVVHQMAASVSSTANALGRSGDSKAEDRASTDVVVGEIANVVRDFARAIYETIAEARNESVVWTASGLDSGDDSDTATHDASTQSLAETVPSKTFKRVWLTELARRLAGHVEAATWETIKQEIEAATSAPEVVDEPEDSEDSDEDDADESPKSQPPSAPDSADSMDKT